ncbi:putative apoptosis regulator protein [Swinepox virus]|uniref:Putative apoptosis regulator protein n=1 Tax=Swinepox virus TaxID=10276 RepID=A0A881SXW9_SWPV|nr:putative apoptosis regulator protein [Swinepox virus]
MYKKYNSNVCIRNVLYVYLKYNTINKLSRYERMIYTKIKNQCEAIKYRYYNDFNSVTCILEYDENKYIDNVHKEVISILLSDSRPSIKLAAISLLSIIIDKLICRNIRIAKYIIDDIINIISEDGIYIILFLDEFDKYTDTRCRRRGLSMMIASIVTYYCLRYVLKI